MKPLSHSTNPAGTHNFVPPFLVLLIAHPNDADFLGFYLFVFLTCWQDNNTACIASQIYYLLMNRALSPGYLHDGGGYFATHPFWLFTAMTAIFTQPLEKVKLA
jgi:hypothetical protein